MAFRALSPSDPAPSDGRTRRKALGAYYTAPAVVEFLVDWGLRTSGGTVMDPSSGDGRFLAAAALRGAERLIGCDLDPAALEAARARLAAATVPTSWHDGDFFLLPPEHLDPVDLIVGNPPFIRYQHFSGESRARALASALRVGARLSRLAASWAPFLLHAMQFLRPGGAMGMVVPAELAQTGYGTETLRALCGGFARLRLITFRHNWFEDAQQETFLLLAEGRGGACGAAELTPLARIDELPALTHGKPSDPAFRLGPEGDGPVGLAFVEPECRALVQALSERSDVVGLRSLGEVTNGYVSGANDFFHCTSAEGARRGLPADWLLPVARNSRSLQGLVFDRNDLEEAERQDIAHHLIVPRDHDLFSADGDALAAFQREGERLGISKRYKCRVRSPWWRVPGLLQAQVLLPYMIGSEPHASLNRCHALYPNSLHGLRLANPALAERIALGLLSSLSLLSMELVGRSYGGGVLKLEPGEMQRLQLVLPTCSASILADAFHRADRLLRSGKYAAAVRVADVLILQEQIGLSAAEVAVLSRGRSALVERRALRSRR
jgi:adenine-specific DNA-methyltransferase